MLCSTPFEAQLLRTGSKARRLPTWASQYLRTKEYCPLHVDNLDSLPNLHRAKAWVDECLGSHRTNCKANEDIATDDGPKWLIDLGNECITPATPDHNYVGLSYVWKKAGAQRFSTLKGTLIFYNAEVL
jgi:hypothetical protein